MYHLSHSRLTGRYLHAFCKHASSIRFCIGIRFHLADGHARRSYVARIPTTFNCSTCHFNAGGGGARNPFGVAFGRVGLNWQGLCQQDSDGDGFTNAEELNDPDCMWQRGQPFERDGQSQPGDATDVPEPQEPDMAEDPLPPEIWEQPLRPRIRC